MAEDKIVDVTLDELEFKSQQEVADYLATKLNKIYGGNTNITPDSVAGQLIGMHAGMFDIYKSLLLTVKRAVDVNTAIGTELDHITAHHGIYRNQGDYSIVNKGSVLGVEGTVVPEGTIFKDSNNNEWELTKEVTITSGLDKAILQAKYVGAITLVSGSILTAKNYINGLQNITLLEDAKVGKTRETDEELRFRYFTQITQNSQHTITAMIANLKKIKGVTDVAIIENAEDNSIRIIVNGGDDDEIVDVIGHQLPLGINAIGSEAQNHLISNIRRLIKFNRPKRIINAHIKLTIKPKNPNSVVDEVAIIKNILTLELSIGDNLYLSDIINKVIEVSNFKDGWAVVNNNVQISKNGKNFTATDLETSVDELIKLAEERITITVER